MRVELDSSTPAGASGACTRLPQSGRIFDAMDA
jgi:hypothetical protein